MVRGFDEAGEAALRELIGEGEAIHAKIGELMGQSLLLTGVKLTVSLLDEDLRDLFLDVEQTEAAQSTETHLPPLCPIRPMDSELLGTGAQIWLDEG